MSIDGPLVGLALLTFLLGCTSEPAPRALQITVAPLSAEGCNVPPQVGLPAEVDRLDVQRRGGRGWESLGQLVEGLDKGELLIEDLATGPADLRFVACAGAEPALVARVPGFELEENTKHYIRLHFRPLGVSSCNGTGLGVEHDQYAELPSGRAFAASARLLDGRIAIIGGAGNVAQDVFSALAGASALAIYKPAEGLFFPGPDRASLQTTRAAVPRVGALALPWGNGALIIGGVPALRFDDQQLGLGPLLPESPAFSEPYVEFFDPESGPTAVQGAAFVRRLGQAGAVEDGVAVMAGGIERVEGALAGSTAVEILDAEGLRRFDLNTPMPGATVTPLRDGRFLVWGPDLMSCGAQPGFIVDARDGTLRPLLLEGAQAAPSCAEPATGCRDWFPTAYHSAVRLVSVDDQPRILIAGGISVGADGLVPNPRPGGACPPNAFVLRVDVDAARATLEQVAIEAELGPLLQRAFMSVARAGDKVMLSGGWTEPNALEAGQQVMFYTDAAPAGRITKAGFDLVVQRIGHFSARLPDGSVVYGAGARREDQNGQRVGMLTASTALYTPPLSGQACAPLPMGEALDAGTD